jgi:transposase
MEQFLQIVEVERIKVLVADREFIGEKWFKWLKENNIPFVIRIKGDKGVKVGKGRVPIASRFSFLAVGSHTFCQKKRELYGYKNLSIIALKTEDDYVILATNINQEFAFIYYKQRWTIELLFSAFKKRGFNLEETHMSANEKIDSLVAILSLAFVWSVSIGEILNEQKPIKSLKHGRKAQSIFLLGLEHLSEIFLNYIYKSNKEIVFCFAKFLELLKNDDY